MTELLRDYVAEYCATKGLSGGVSTSWILGQVDYWTYRQQQLSRRVISQQEEIQKIGDTITRKRVELAEVEKRKAELETIGYSIEDPEIAAVQIEIDSQQASVRVLSTVGLENANSLLSALRKDLERADRQVRKLTDRAKVQADRKQRNETNRGETSGHNRDPKM